MIVVDTNVLMPYCLRTDLTEAAYALAARDPDWHAPELWRSEFRNVLAGEMRRRQLSLARARDAMADAEVCLRNRSHRVSSDRVLHLIAESTCTAYDLEFVALAQALGAPLITMDRKILQAFPGLAVPLVETNLRPAR